MSPIRMSDLFSLPLILLYYNKESIWNFWYHDIEKQIKISWYYILEIQLDMLKCDIEKNLLQFYQYKLFSNSD